MSTSASIPGRMIRILPENGYESPRSPYGGSQIYLPSIDATRERVKGGISTENGFTAFLERGETHETAKEKQHAQDEARKTMRVGFQDRIGCYTWTWFTMTMATGGLASALHAIPYRSNWLRIIGTCVCLFNIALFLTNCVFITLRFRWNPGSLKASFISPSESLFIPASVVSMGTIFINLCQYGIPELGPWFQKTMQICFWIYIAISIIVSSMIYLIIWSTQTFPIHTMTPIWIFPAYPLLLAAPLAANFLDSLPDPDAAARIHATIITFGAICVQGTGFCVSILIYSAFIYRLMTQKLPRETTRPGMFVSVGPSGFTVAGLVHLGNIVQTKIMPNGFEGHADAGFFLKLISDLVGLWLWGFCIWFFIVSVGAHSPLMRVNDPKHHIRFDMTWFSFVFPNTAMLTATQAIGRSFSANSIQIVATIMTGALILVYFFVVYMMIRGLMLRRLLWPDHQTPPPEIAAEERLRNTIEGAQKELRRLKEKGVVRTA